MIDFKKREGLHELREMFAGEPKYLERIERDWPGVALDIAMLSTIRKLAAAKNYPLKRDNTNQ
jgi:hypothetical protein